MNRSMISVIGTLTHDFSLVLVSLVSFGVEESESRLSSGSSEWSHV